MEVSRAQSEDFVIGSDDFAGLEIRQGKGDFYYFFDKQQRRLIKRFVLDASKPRSTLYCVVTLIKKRDRFTPRFEFTRRAKDGKTLIHEPKGDEKGVSARIDLGDCHAHFWALINFLESFAEVDTPDHAFSLITQGDARLVDAIKERSPESVTEIVKTLAQGADVSLSQADINQILDRKGKLREFANGLSEHGGDEGWWQSFFLENKWIFGYGLNYQIIGVEQAQPSYGGTRVEGKGGQKGDYLGATQGDLRFTVLVEIKTPDAPLLAGTEEIRSGAWSLSKELTDGVAQLQSNVQAWETQGAPQEDNRDRLEGSQIYTVRPRGILVLGRLSQLGSSRSKRGTLQRFRMGMHGIEVITFDELQRRAQFIVAQDEQ